MRRDGVEQTSKIEMGLKRNGMERDRVRRNVSVRHFCPLTSFRAAPGCRVAWYDVWLVYTLHNTFFNDFFWGGGGQPIAARVAVSRWLSTLNFSNTLNELIFLLFVNPTLLSPHCAI